MTASLSMRLRNKRLGGGALILLGRLFSGSSQVVLVAMLARSLSQADVGKVLLLTSLAGILAVVSRFGFDVLVGKELALLRGAGRTEGLPTIARTHFFGMLYASSTLLLILLLAAHLLQETNAIPSELDSLQMALWLAIWAFGLALQFFVGEALRGIAEVAASVWLAGLLSQVLALGGICALVYGSSAPPSVSEIAALLTSIALLTGLAGMAYLFRRLGSLSRCSASVPHTPVLRLFGESFPIFLSTLALAIALAGDLWIVAWFFDSATTSVYGAAAKIGMLLSLGLVVMAGVLLPTIGEALGGGQRVIGEQALRSWATGVGAASIVSWLGLLLYGPALLRALYGEGYDSGAQVLIFIGGGYALGNWFGVGQQVLIAGGHGVKVLGITLGSMAVSLVTAVTCAAFGWMEGVALGMGIGVVARQYVFAREAHRLCGLKPEGTLKGLAPVRIGSNG